MNSSLKKCGISNSNIDLEYISGVMEGLRISQGRIVKIINDATNESLKFRATHIDFLNDFTEHTIAASLLKEKLIEYDNSLDKNDKKDFWINIKNTPFYGTLDVTDYAMLFDNSRCVQLQEASHYFKSFFIDEKERKLYGDLYFLENEIGPEARTLLEKNLAKFSLRGYGTYEKISEILSFDIVDIKK